MEHGQFGRGRVVDIEGERDKQRVRVIFESGETKQLMVAYAGLRVLEA